MNKETIMILASLKDEDVKTMLYYIAANYPDIFIKSHRFLKNIPVYNYITGRSYANKVEAVKDVKREFNLGLKEAKDVVDSYEAEFGVMFSKVKL